MATFGWSELNSKLEAILYGFLAGKYWWFRWSKVGDTDCGDDEVEDIGDTDEALDRILNNWQNWSTENKTKLKIWILLSHNVLYIW